MTVFRSSARALRVMVVAAVPAVAKHVHTATHRIVELAHDWFHELLVAFTVDLAKEHIHFLIDLFS